MKTKLSDYYENRIKMMMDTLTDKQKEVVQQYMKDDAGSDLISFFEEDLNVDEEVIEEIQMMLELKYKATYLEARDERLTEIENVIRLIKTLTV